MIGQVVSQGVYYYVYQWAVEVIMKLKNITKVSRMSMLDNVIVAAVAGIATVLASTPVWTINMRMTVAKKAQTQNTSTPGGQQTQDRKSLLGTAMEIIQERGIAGLWSGLLPALILVSNPIIQYVLFERLKILIARRRERGRLTDGDNFWLGAFTKLVATTVTYPYLVIKARLQVKSGATDSSKYNGMTDTISKIAKDEGVAGFYRGLQPKLVHSVLTAALLFQTKEFSTRYTLAFLRLFGIGNIKK
eukprot:TRINITY_DN2510_c0_g1_i2.p1 TRINITY_DN2510_c0_g1~~TRINITY_DN2510_c0_g1_i2.p1  ORF type:complete len:247 (-),score=38.84 TRINITY_DN2510_c0_g1_i2:10-750(-)